MGENNSKWNNWQRTNLQNIQAYEAQYQKSKQPNSKVSTRLRHFSKEGIHMANKHMKNAQHHSLLEKCKSKLQWGIISHPSEWPSSKSLKAINVGEGVEKKQPSCTVGGNANWYNYGEQYGDSLRKLGIKLPYGPTIPLLGIYLEKP